MRKLLRRLATAPLTGAVGGVVSAFWEAVWFMGPLLGYDPPERRLYLLIGFLAFVGFAIQAFWAQANRVRRLEAKVMELEAKSEPSVEIVFEPKNDSDSRPYLQTMTFSQPSADARPMIERIDRRYRVGVRNTSDALVPAVSLRLQSCEPSGNFVFLEHELQVQDTDPPAGACEIPPHQTRWFDVVSEQGVSSQVPQQFHFCYRNPNFSGLPVPAGSYEITLRADGGGPSVTRDFRITKNCVDETYDRLAFRTSNRGRSNLGLYDHAINATEAPGRVVAAVSEASDTIDQIGNKLLKHANIVAPVKDIRLRKTLVETFASDVTPDVAALGRTASQIEKQCSLIRASYQRLFEKVQINSSEDRDGIVEERHKFATLGQRLSGAIGALENRRDIMKPLEDLLPDVGNQYDQAMTVLIDSLKDLQDFSINTVRITINKRIGPAERLSEALRGLRL